MKAKAKDTRTNIIPCMLYRDASAAVAWLCKAFGFEQKLVVPHPDGNIAHAELTFGNGMIMLGSIQPTQFDRFMKQPSDLGNVETQTPYVIVEDADAHYARAKS